LPYRNKALQEAYYRRNRKKILARGRRRYRDNRKKMLVAAKAYYKANRKTLLVKGRDANFKKKYGFSLEGYNILIKNQKGLCAICKSFGTRRKNGEIRLGVDHDHITSAIRGLLCDRCNFMLGSAKDDPVILEAGASYLRASKQLEGVSQIG
jgi:hypothetical protein